MRLDVRFPWLALAACLGLSATACSDESVNLDFTRRVRPEAPSQARDVSALTIGIGAMTGPEETYESHAALMRYLARATGREANIVQRRTYQEMNHMLLDGEADVALICTGAYVAVHDRVVLLAVPLFGGHPSYQSNLIARRPGPESFESLRGGHFAFTDPLSNTGRLYPIYFLHEHFDASPREFFGALTYSGAHDASVRLVAAGSVDGAAVDGLVLDRMIDDAPELADRLTVLHRSPPFGAPPFVARRDLPQPLVDELREALLGAGDDPAAQVVLRGMGIDGFVAEADYALAMRVSAIALGDPVLEVDESARERDDPGTPRGAREAPGAGAVVAPASPESAP